MFARIAVALLCFASLSGLTSKPGLAAADDGPGFTNLVPQKAIGSLFFRNINELRRNGDRLFAEVGWPFAPSQLLQFAGTELKVNGLVNGERPCGVAFFDSEDEQRSFLTGLPPVVALFAIRDLDALAQRLNTTTDDLRSGRTIEEKGRLGYERRFYRFVDDYLWIASEERLFTELSNRMPLNFVIAKSRRERMQNCDILISFRPTAREEDREQMLKNGQRWVDEHPELSVEEQTAIRELFAALEAMSNAVLGVRVHADGIEVDGDIYFDFRKRKVVQAVLQRFNPTNASSSLHDLPDGRVLFSHALQADGEATLPALNALLPKLSPFQGWRTRKLEVLTEAQQLKMLGLLGEVWRRINGYRMAAYQTADPAQQGMLGVAAVLDTSNPEQVIAEIRDLAEFIDGTHLYLTQDTAAEAADDDASSQQPAVPQLSPAGKARVRSLVTQLNDADFAVRQSATIRLMLIGEPVRSFVEPLAAQGDPPSDKPGDTQPDNRANGQARQPLPANVRHARRVVASLNATQQRLSRPNALPRLINSADLRFEYSTRQIAAESRNAAKRTIHEIVVRQTSAAPAQAALHQQMRKLFGPDWNRLRLVPLDGRLIVLLGSDQTLQQRVVASVAAGDQGLQTATASSVFGSPLNAARGAEFHVNLAGVLAHFSRRIPAKKPEVSTIPQDRDPADDAAASDVDQASATSPRSATTPARTSDSIADGRTGDAAPAIDFSSLTFTIQDDYLSIEWRVPVRDIKAINAMK
ncbi:MAG: hypothetical protein ACYTGL_11640 [Planctomycetota bacterium]|jgi:hypothetical protein